MELNVTLNIKKTKVKNNNKVPIYVRLTYNHYRIELATKQYVEIDKWDNRMQQVKGNNEAAKTTNHILQSILTNINKVYYELMSENISFTVFDIRDKYRENKKPNVVLLLEVFKKHNNNVKMLIGKGFSKPTYTKFETTYKHLENFINVHYEDADYNVNKVNLDFIENFEYFLKKNNCNQNITMKYISNLKKIILHCYGNKWIEYNPFNSYKIKLERVERQILSYEEVNKIINKEFKIERLDKVRDCFIFCCFTGLAFKELSALTKENIIEEDGVKYIKQNRQKTNNISIIPLLPKALEILEKYDYKLPVNANQKMNAYLKEIAAVCDINKNLTTHIGRHTFATTITLANGVPIESISKMLSHTSIKTTQIYTKIQTEKLKEDMQNLSIILQNKKKNNPLAVDTAGGFVIN